MSVRALERLTHAQATLIVALDSDHIDGIEAATAELAQALGEVRAAGAWREHPDLRSDIIEALRMADAARGRINYLADRTRRRLDLMFSLASGSRAQSYRRDGTLG